MNNNNNTIASDEPIAFMVSVNANDGADIADAAADIASRSVDELLQAAGDFSHFKAEYIANKKWLYDAYGDDVFDILNGNAKTISFKTFLTVFNTIRRDVIAGDRDAAAFIMTLCDALGVDL